MDRGNYEASACGDCAVLEGEIHEVGCDHEMCSKCGKQVLGWEKCKDAPLEPFFETCFCCQRCGVRFPKLVMVSNEEWKFICGGTYELDCVLCEKCMNFIKIKREVLRDECKRI